MKDIEGLSIEELEMIDGTEELVASLKTLNKFIKECDNIPIISSNHNWFIPPSIKLSVLKRILHAYENENTINTIFMQYYKGNMDTFINNLCITYKERSEIIQEAYLAHNNKNFYSSIVLFSTQIDGIAKKLTGHCFFQGGDWKKVPFEHLKTKLAYSFVQVFFDSDDFKPRIKHTENERKNGQTYNLNRHLILHGEVVGFNTETNSLKVFSLLIALTESLEWIEHEAMTKGKED